MVASGKEDNVGLPSLTMGADVDDLIGIFKMSMTSGDVVLCCRGDERGAVSMHFTPKSDPNSLIDSRSTTFFPQA